MLHQSENQDYYFFDCVITSYLCLFQYIGLLYPCFKFSKNFISSLIDKVTIGTKNVALIIIRFVHVILSWYCINRYFFVHNKSSFYFTSYKWQRDIQKLFRYLSGIVTSTFKIGTGDCLYLLHFEAVPVFFPLFLSYIQMIYHLKHYYQRHQFHLYNNSINF